MKIRGFIIFGLIDDNIGAYDINSEAEIDTDTHEVVALTGWLMDFDVLHTRVISRRVIFDNDIGKCFRYPLFHISKREEASAWFGYNVYWYK